MLPLLCNFLPLHDEVCSRSISFISRCMSHQSSLIRDIATFGVQFARVISPLGRNIMFCVRHYRFSFCDFMFERIDMRDVKSYLSRSVPERNIATANFLKELVSLRDRTSFFTPDSSFMRNYDAIRIIRYYIVCCEDVGPIFVIFSLHCFFVLFIFLHVFYHMLCTMTHFVNCITVPLCVMIK